MNYSYVCSTASEIAPVKRKNPLAGEAKEFDISDCCDELIAYQHSQIDQSIPEIDHVEHWWNRKWQVCLDFYLATPNDSNLATVEPAIGHASSIDIGLPIHKPQPEFSVIEALQRRKTHRKFQEDPLDLEIFAAMLAECSDELFEGIWRYYLVIFDVKNVAPGIYCYSAHAHGLSLIKEGLFREEAVKLLCGMSASMSASFLVILSVDIQEAMRRFPYSRALREIYIDAGRLAQKLLLKGMQYGVGGLPSPAIRDTPMCNFLNLDPNQCIPLYTVTMGVIPKRDL